MSHKWVKTAFSIVAVLWGASALASETYTFTSPELDSTSFSIVFTTPATLADGSYHWATTSLGQPNTNLPAGVSFVATDGYTTLTDPADLGDFDFNIAGGQLTGTYVLDVQDPSNCDSYYGCTSLYGGANAADAGVGTTQLYDNTDPGIVGIDYAGHHIPVANGGIGTFTQSGSVSAVPEPATLLMLAIGAGLLVSQKRRLGR
jgi:hypothetical protein